MATLSKPPRAPAGLKVRGRGFWREITATYVLEVGELQILRELCRTVDRIDELSRIVDEDGLLVTGSRGQIPKSHPALFEIREEQKTVVRLMNELALPPTDEQRGA